MSHKNVFQRYELKYLLTPEQKTAVLTAMADQMRLDRYGRTTIRNLYFDDDSYRLIRRSIEKPSSKEKLRVRSYGRAEHDSPVFVELKKKYDGVVYKRRVSLPESVAMDWLTGGKRPVDSQICREIDYFIEFYKGLRPSVFLSYEREAYFPLNGREFRVTFDENIFARREDLSLTSDAYGFAVLPEGRTLMEIKCPGAIPLWMASVLSKNKIYKTSFSKYGRTYVDYLLPNIINNKEQV